MLGLQVALGESELTMLLVAVLRLSRRISVAEATKTRPAPVTVPASISPLTTGLPLPTENGLPLIRTLLAACCTAATQLSPSVASGDWVAIGVFCSTTSQLTQRALLPVTCVQEKVCM